MVQDDQRNNHPATEINLAKRRRGRPRKYPAPTVNHEENAVPRVQNLQRQGNAPMLPGIAGVNNYQPSQVNANDASIDGGDMPSVPILPSHPVPKNKGEPVVLQPVNLSTGGTVANQTPTVFPTTLLETFKGKQVMNASCSNASKPTNQVETVGNQVLPSAPTNNQDQERPNSVPLELLLQAEANTMKLPCSPLEFLVAEVVSRYLPPSQSNKSQMDNENEISDMDMDQVMENMMNENTDMDPLFVEPLRTVQTDPYSPASLPKTSDDFGTGQMTMPLQDDGGHSNVGGRRKRACTICGQEGHNRKTCRNKQT